ncbi:MAG TPA: fibronectin type III domain-containing protein [Bryobacteraceae bacterium]|nr:fibronectin type III domain-containing protein [Bryobacteraceae bacterium]
MKFTVFVRALQFSLFVVALFGLLTATAFAAPPEFAVTTSDGGFRVFSSYTQVSPTQYSVSDPLLNATITDLGGGRWKLDITGVKQALATQYFPWQSQRSPLDSDISNDIYYYPNLMGRTEKATNRNQDWGWYGSLYPGPIAAPLTVMADPASAKIVAAINWPPKTVAPQYAAQRMVLRYDKVVPVGGSISYQALIATVTGNAAVGDVPWQKALDLYKAWLDSSMGKLTYPSWMWDGQGMLNLQLQGYPDTTTIANAWEPNKALYPWLLMWGQMSPYGGSCCGIDLITYRYYSTLPDMDGRFLPTLPTWLRNTVVSNGYHGGYYSAPYSEYYSDGPRRYLDTAEGVNWFTAYNSANQSYGANSYYFDTLAREYWGDPAQIVTLFNNGVISKDALGEGIVDVYPIPALVSGSLAGANYCGAPHKTPENTVTTTFPPFVRYMLNDRMIYWGASNDDGQFWGTATPSGCDYSTWCANGACNYGIERQILLTGARIEFRPRSSNIVLDAIVSERQRVNWWQRRPVYLANKGLNLSGIPAASRIEVSRFRDINGVDMLAVSNPNLVSGAFFTLNSNTFTVPAQRVAILDNAGGALPDVTPPSIPTGLSATATSATQITVSWAASVDNVGVSGYRVYRDGTQIATVSSGTSYPDSGLQPATSYSYSVAAYDAAANTSGPSASVSATTQADSTNQGPQLGPVSPASGSGASQVFTFSFTDPNGRADITDTYAMINASYTNGTNTCWFHYNLANNTLQLSYDDTPTTLTWQPPVPLGSGAAQQNSQCGIDPAGARIAGSGDTLTVSVPVTFMPAWSGLKNIYVYARDKAGVSAGYTVAASWTVAEPAQLDTTAPSVPTGLAATAASSTQINLSWNASIDNVGVAGYTVYRGGVRVAEVTSGTNYTDTGLAPSTSYSYSVAAYDASGNTSGQSANASATTQSEPVTVVNQPPRVGTVSPAQGTGLRQAFAFTYTDGNGYADITDAYFMINSSYTNGANTCWVHYNRATNSIRLSYDDTPSTLAWQPAMRLGTNSTQQNSQCSITAAGATAKASGKKLTLTVPTTFLPAWSGAKDVYSYVSDKAGATAGYTAMGTWTVPSR